MAKKKDEIEISMDEAPPSEAKAAREFVFVVQRIQNCHSCDSAVCSDHWQSWLDTKKAVFGS